MSRRMSREALLDRMDADVAWRRVELSALKGGLASAQGNAIDTAARTAVALSYAHWEGYVVAASRTLVAYVAGLQLTYDQLTDNYVALCLAGKLLDAENSVRRVQRHVDVINEIRLSEKAAFPHVEKTIHAEGNLKSDKFKDIVLRLGLEQEPFELHLNWVDRELLRRRNSIAHGNSERADRTFAAEALSNVSMLLGHFRTAVQNAAATEVWRAPH